MKYSVPFYDPKKSYEENYKDGPFGYFATPAVVKRTLPPQHHFFSIPVYTPFGIPAGPLVQSTFVAAAFRKGFDICTYKTVRTKPYPCHPWPNVLAVHPKDDLLPQLQNPLVADSVYTSPLSITNSFGVPSVDPNVWQKDMKKAIDATGKGQVMVGSFQGTSDGSGNVKAYIDDFVLAAKLVAETGALVLEANLSCPNEGTSNLLCFDLEKTRSIAFKIKETIGNTPLMLKIAYFQDNNQLELFIKTLGKIVDGFSAINTIAATIVDKNGAQALPGEGRLRSGVCGASIRWAGVQMVQRLHVFRERYDMSYTIIGVGGVYTAKDYQEYRNSGADAVMSATGAMWNPKLAQHIWEEQIQA